ncbi:3-oxoacyl-[acyl-carrier-protein] synthase II [Maribacter dokdonensis]|uniref:3-oxoacyl-[acyl-carrier-protein] synthase 2 n=1 Tax=Maribacter dokdonensis TaxID=320912 RepID=A0ABY0UMR6_9FLAO|nr:beta-ketoacyl-ACP synthase II [Maribacter dokdonensis]SDS92377.1 3-oxoacyl-[acyl-carrier-protein] synthase II [Maribacter dokdonensis]
MKRVVITGLGAITPIGNKVESYWKNLLKGVSGADKITRFDTTNFKTDFACEVKNYNPLDYFDRKESRKLDRFNQYGLIACEEAIADADLQFENLNKDRIGVIFSSGIGGFETFENEILNFFENASLPRFNPFFITKLIANGVAGLISIRHGLRGVNSCPVTACASSTNGLIQAYNYIKWGKADIIITGGSEAPITKSSIGGFNAMKALSTNNENYKTASRPFDTSRDGFVIGEGAGTLVVESLESAKKRGAKIYAEIIGGAETADAYHITGTHPEGQGAYLAMKQAIEESKISSYKIDYINAHATSTGLGDISEIMAIKKLFAKSLDKITISATKSMTGHLLGATGAIEAIATCLTLNSNMIPPTLHTKKIDERIPANLDFSLGRKTEKNVNYALTNSFGFGGHCAAMVLKKYTS